MVNYIEFDEKQFYEITSLIRGLVNNLEEINKTLKNKNRVEYNNITKRFKQ